MKLEERHYWLGFNIFPGIGPKRFFHLLKTFSSAKKAWNVSEDKLQQTNIPKSIIKRFSKFRETIDFSWQILRLEKRLIRFIIVDDKEYPKNLKKIDFPPPILYVRGRLLPQDNLSIAVVGTRKITPYGREATEKLVSGLVAYDFTIVSGLARGVDGIAHQTALANGGRTLAVLGSGLDRIYPPEHKPLVEKIIHSGQGAVISELPLNTAPLKGHFPSRNRIISGLSLGVLVTEGAAVSGTKITSRFALEQKRKILAVPGPITSMFSEGPAELIKKGAKLVTKTEDILREIGEDIRLTRVSLPSLKALKFKNKREEKIWRILSSGLKHIDEIVIQSKFSSAEVLSCLTELELRGKVKNIGQGNYMLV